MKTSDSRFKELIDRFPQFQEALTEVQTINDLGLHAAQKCVVALDDTLELVDNHISRCKIAITVTSLMAVTALREAVDAAAADGVEADASRVLDFILQTTRNMVVQSLAKATAGPRPVPKADADED